MKATLILLALSVTTASMAQPSQDARSLPCDAAGSLVRRSGEVILRTGPHLYDRYVRDGSFCSRPQVPRAAFIATSDQKRCPVGYVCIDRPDIFGF
jgi:hypothetical protein